MHMINALRMCHRTQLAHLNPPILASRVRFSGCYLNASVLLLLLAHRFFTCISVCCSEQKNLTQCQCSLQSRGVENIDPC